MGQDFLAFWRMETHIHYLSGGRMLDYAASIRYSRVEASDTVWIVSVRSGRLRLIGRIIIDQVTDMQEAARIIGREELWPASHYILPAPDTIRPAVDIDIHYLVPVLRFAGVNDHLKPKPDGKVSGSQFQQMRRLSGDSPRLLLDALAAAECVTCDVQSGI